MNFKIVTLFVLLIYFFTACKKKMQYPAKNSVVSTWIINNDTISSDQVSLAEGKSRAGFLSEQTFNKFILTFYVDYFPTEGKWSINNGQNLPPDIVYLNFFHGSGYYLMSPNENGYLEASVLNGKASYKLKPTWFVDYRNNNDSVLISGTFNEP